MPWKLDKTPEHHLITVFEVANATLKEIYLGKTRLLISELVQQFDAPFAEPIRHWRREHDVRIRCVEYSIAAGEADAFIEARARLDALEGWVVRHDSSSKTEPGEPDAGRTRAGEAKRPSPPA